MTTNKKTKSAINTTLLDNGIYIVSLDILQESMNVLRLSLIDDLTIALETANNNADIKALVFTSGKKDSFIAGADIAMIDDANSAEKATDLAEKLQDATRLIAALKKPTVAAVHGACLGGGLELAMAFDYRVASTDKKTKFGLPEVQLGLLPGGSGTQRLPRLIDLPTALDMMLTGKQLDARRAYKAGLVDDICAPSILMDVAEKIALKAIDGEVLKKKSSLKNRLIGTGAARAVIFNQAGKKLLAKTQGNYPAPEKILEVTKIGLDKGFEAGLHAERQAFGQLAMSPESKELRQIFFATTALKKDSGVDGDVQARDVDKVGVLGAGLMGAGIAYVSAKNAGVNVRIKDRDNEGAARGIAYISKILTTRVKRRRMSALQKRQLESKITVTKNYNGFSNADIVIEAVFEDLSLKRQMIKDIELIEQDKEIIFATNTSAIPINEIAKGAKQPEKVIGLHYFSPVERMPLLEVVVGQDTSDWVTATCVEFGKKQGKTVIVVNDGPGFYTTRILAPFIQEAIYLIQEGVPIERIDKALQAFGFPIGPITLLDEVGIDVGIHIAETLHEAFGERAAPAPHVNNVIDDGRQGKKNKKGFYQYGEKRRRSKSKQVDESIYSLLGVSETNNQMDDNQIVERCVLRMVNEAVHCLDEGVLRSARDGDIGAVFGLGFPPFLGGPFRYIDAKGIDDIAAKLSVYQEKYGNRFELAKSLSKKSKKTFY